MIYVGRLPSNAPINKLGITLQDKVSWKTFQGHGGTAFASIRRLKESEFYRQLMSNPVTYDPAAIRTYRAVMVYKYRDDREPRHLEELDAFKKEHPDILVIDKVSRPYAANKELTDLLFEDNLLEKYRPKTRIYRKVYSPSLATRINREFKSSKYVIKPLNSGMSNGVVVVPRTKLDKALISA